MASPNSAGISRHVQGLRDAKAAFRALPEIVRDRLLTATETTVREIARGAQARLQASPAIRTRALYNHVRWQVTKTSGRGRVGVATGATTLRVGDRKVRVKGIVVPGRGGSAKTSEGAQVVRPSRYAHLVEFGARHMKAEPFMLPAAEAQTQPFLDRCRAQGRNVERDVAKIGGRFV